MNDPYKPLEAKLNLTGRALARHRRVLLSGSHPDQERFGAAGFGYTARDQARSMQRSALPLRPPTTSWVKWLEPGASLVSERFKAMQALASNVNLTGITMMPILPFIEDNEENITQIVTRALRVWGCLYHSAVVRHELA